MLTNSTNLLLHFYGKNQGNIESKEFFISWFWILGCYQWRFYIEKDHKANEGTCVGVSKWPVNDYNHRTTDDMWLYRAYRFVKIFLIEERMKFRRFWNIYFLCSGNLYHNGELTYSLSNFTKGDYIIAVLDLDARTLSFGKNKGEITVAFDNIDVSSPLYPCVVFYSNNPGEKVKFSFPKIEKNTFFWSWFYLDFRRLKSKPCTWGNKPKICYLVNRTVLH